MGKTIMLLSLLLVAKQRQTEASSDPSSGRLKGSGAGKGKPRKGGTLVVGYISIMTRPARKGTGRMIGRGCAHLYLCVCVCCV